MYESHQREFFVKKKLNDGVMQSLGSNICCESMVVRRWPLAKLIRLMARDLYHPSIDVWGGCESMIAFAPSIIEKHFYTHVA